VVAVRERARDAAVGERLEDLEGRRRSHYRPSYVCVRTSGA
jgi:hypothetical protein